jgi:hypothetical protein
MSPIRDEQVMTRRWRAGETPTVSRVFQERQLPLVP